VRAQLVFDHLGLVDIAIYPRLFSPTTRSSAATLSYGRKVEMNGVIVDVSTRSFPFPMSGNLAFHYLQIIKSKATQLRLADAMMEPTNTRSCILHLFVIHVFSNLLTKAIICAFHASHQYHLLLSEEGSFCLIIPCWSTGYPTVLK